MRKIVCLFYIAASLAAFSVSAQDQKAAIKEWEKTKKAMDPLELKRIVEENAAQKTEVANLNTQLQEAQAKLKAKEAELATVKANTIAVPKESNETDASPNAHKYQSEAGGLIYKVQIGAFRNKDLTKYFENNSNFSGDVDKDGTKKYTLGYFSNYWEADHFKKYLREMGVKDAWIVAYKGSQRIEIKDALEGSIR